MGLPTGRLIAGCRGYEELGPVRAIFQAMGRRTQLASDLEVGCAGRDDPHAEPDRLRYAFGATRAERDAFRDERDRAFSSLREAEERLAIAQVKSGDLHFSPSFREFRRLMLVAARSGPSGRGAGWP